MHNITRIIPIPLASISKRRVMSLEVRDLYLKNLVPPWQFEFSAFQTPAIVTSSRSTYLSCSGNKSDTFYIHNSKKYLSPWSGWHHAKSPMFQGVGRPGGGFLAQSGFGCKTMRLATEWPFGQEIVESPPGIVLEHVGI
eukprot:s4199_g2.t1